MALTGYLELPCIRRNMQPCRKVWCMSRFIGWTTYRLWPSKILLEVGAQPLAGGRSMNWSDKICSTNDLSSDGSPGATTTVLRMAVRGLTVVVGITPMDVR